MPFGVGCSVSPGSPTCVAPPAGSTFSPTDISDCIFFFEPDQVSTLTKDGSDRVSGMDNLGTTESDYTQSNAAYQPLYVSNGMNNKGVLRFDGTRFMDLTANVSLVGDFDVFVVFKKTGSVVGFERILDHNYLTGFFVGRNSSVADQMGGGVQHSASPYGIYTTCTDGAAHLLQSTRSGSTHTIRIDSGTYTTSETCPTTTTSTQNIKLCSGFAGSGIYQFVGDLALVLIYDKALNATERGQVETYADKFGL